MFTKFSLIALLAVSAAVVTSGDAFAFHRGFRASSTPIFSSSRSDSVPFASTTTSRSFFGPSGSSPTCCSPAPTCCRPMASAVSTPHFMLSNMDPHKHD